MYNHTELETAVQKFWEENKIYEKAKEKVKNGKFLYFLDGPPYATGEIHPGTAWNKTMKDAYLRFFRMSGYNVHDQPGFDTHGLPIEVKVEKKLGIKHKSEIEELGIEKFIEECKAFVDTYIKIMTEQFQRFGVWMDWKNPYITYHDSYIEKTWQTMKKAWQKGLLKEDFYVLPYCFRCETTLANYELEYHNVSDPSIIVKFPIKDKTNEFLLIWTTTPWTLVANLGVMAHPDLDYVKVKIEDEVWILAEGQLEHVQNLINKSFTVIEKLKGKELSGLVYEHPFQDMININYQRKIVLSEEYVHLGEGTGLVHMAPGHGPEDFQVGKKYGIPIISPVDEHGNYTAEAGKFAGKNVLEANEEIIKLLEERGLLVYKGKITHRYPLCWRCKTKLIYRATQQWFISITAIKEKMKEEAAKVLWIPEFAHERFQNFLDTAPDWCISRQRYWGIPLPIWRCKNGHIKVIGSKSEIPAVKELHRPYIDEVKLKCPVCGEEMTRVPDVLDVWFDSGNAAWASLDKEVPVEIADFILEGQDQIRGWFYSLLGSGIIHYDRSPYKAVIMHGFFVDEKGEKMSKSLGNFVPVMEVLKRYGADAFRLFGMSNNVWEDLKFKWEALKEAKQELDVVINLTTYLQRNFNRQHVAKPKLELEDLWILSRLHSVVLEYRKAFSTYRHFNGVRALRKFIIDDVSKFYMKLVKKRVTENENAEGALDTLYQVMKAVIVMLAPIAPHVAEHCYQSFFRKYEGVESVHLLDMVVEDIGMIDKQLETKVKDLKEVIEHALRLRNEMRIKLRWPIRAVYTDVRFKPVGRILRMLVNAKHIYFELPEELRKSAYIADGWFVAIDSNLDEQLYQEAIRNEIIRRIQVLRKEHSLTEQQPIRVYIQPGKLEKYITRELEHIKKRVNATEIKISETKGKVFDIDNKQVTIRIELV